jgi:hypothetical protein
MAEVALMKLWRQFTRMWRQRNAPSHPRHRKRQPPRHGGGSHRRQLPARSLRSTAFHRLRRLFNGVAKPRLMRGRVVAYHGTPSVTNAKSICRDGFMAGSGNALGDGTYLATDVASAKTYAGSAGVYVKCLVTLGRTCVWGAPMQARYAAWCQRHGVQQDNSAMTAFLLRNAINTIQNGKVVVVLSPGYRNPTAWKQKSRFIKVLSVHRASNDARINV